MTTHLIADVLHGIIRFRREKVTTGDFLLKKTITVANGDLINITENYTSNGSTNSKTIFRGRIIDVDYAKTQYVHAIDVADELNQVRPSGIYHGYTEVVFGAVVNDNSLANVLCTESTGNATIYPDSDEDPNAWTPTVNQYTYLNDESDATYLTSNASMDYDTWTMANHILSSSYNYLVYKVEVNIRANKTDLGSRFIWMKFYDGTSWKDAVYTVDLTKDTYITYTFTYDNLLLTQDDVNNFKVSCAPTNHTYIRMAGVSVKFYYKYYPNLIKGTVKGTYDLNGNKPIKEVFKVLNIKEFRTWYVDPDLQIHFDGGDVASGESVIITDKMKNIVGSRQVMDYDRVVLYGGYTAGAQIVADRGGGNIIWRDNYLNISDQTELDALADQILVEQGANTIKVQMMRTDSADGVYQVSETLAVGAGIKFSGSDKTIPTGAYIVNKIDYIITDGIYNTLDIELIDGLLFSTPKDDQITVTQEVADENTTAISQVAGGESVGQANVGSNVGSDGVGVYDGKSGVTLQFRHIAPASSKVTVVLNSKDIDIDIVVGSDANSVCVGNDSRLSDARTPLAHVLTTSGPHTGTLPWTDLSKTGSSLGDLVTRAHSNLSDAPTDAHHNEAHVLGTSGPHTGTLPLTDLAVGTQGDIIRRGAADWEALAKGTTGYRLKTDGTNAVWANTVDNTIYDADTWNPITDVAPSKHAVRDVFVALTGAVIYMGTWNPNDANYPTSGIGYYYICSHDGYHAADADGTPERWYEIGDWIVYNTTDTDWDILRNVFGDNVIGVSPGDNIQTAIDEIESLGNGVVRLLPGTHNLSATLTIDNASVDIVLQGTGDTTIINCNGNRTALHVDLAASVIIKNIEFDGTDITTNFKEIIKSSCDNAIFENLNLYGNATNKQACGFLVQCANNEIKNCRFEDLYYGIYTNGSLVLDCSFIGNRLIDITYHGIYLYDEARRCMIKDNYLYNCGNVGGWGITLYDACHYCIVEGNIIRDNRNGIYMNGSDYNIICNNQILNPTLHSIQITLGDYNFIYGNMMSNGVDGIWLNSGNSNKIGQNYYYNNSGENIDDDATGTIICGDDTAYAASWNGDLGTPTKNTIYDAIEPRCRMKSGTYVGNAANNRQITGLGFTPKHLIIWYYNSVSIEYYTYTVNDQMTEWLAVSSNGYGQATNHMKIITDGFEVNNNQSVDFLNENGKTHVWSAWG